MANASLRRLAIPVGIALALLLFLFLPTTGSAAPGRSGAGSAKALAQLPSDSYRTNPAGLVPGTAYDYAPSIMEDRTYRMWWCGAPHGDTVPGDDIMYAEADSPGGPFRQQRSVFNGRSDGWDQHTCDPSVLRVNGTYYMFYGGIKDPYPANRTEIGLATSTDGLNWQRAHDGRPIISPSFDVNRANKYGAGQPSAIYRDGKFYLLFTDTTGRGADAGGSGQFAWRSADPTFQKGVEVATAHGWRPRTDDNGRNFSVVKGFSVDWQYSDALDAFIVASNGPRQDGTVLHFLDGNDLRVHPYADGFVPGTWTEGPGIVSRPDKHARASSTGDCGRIPIDLVQSTTTFPPRTPGRFGLDLLSGKACTKLSPKRVGAIFEGYGIQVQGLPATYVTDGRRLQFAKAEPYLHVTGQRIGVSSETFHRIPYGASLHAGQKAVAATGRPGAFLLDDRRLWPVDSDKLITSNGSSLTRISTDDYDSHPVGPALRLRR
ncbi:hypothetical protein [Streptomyces sp. NPDC050355]|uniref:hypothetical protein n=1 Tax=Streptomyces sp. NPDC050355 TaxID=3365609 RepID=UPI0037B81D3E